MLDYQTVERFICKLQASNDMLSQFACWTSFEAQYPPNSQAFATYSDSLQGVGLLIAAIVGFVIIQARPNRAPPPRRWIDRF